MQCVLLAVALSLVIAQVNCNTDSHNIHPKPCKEKSTLRIKLPPQAPQRIRIVAPAGKKPNIQIVPAPPPKPLTLTCPGGAQRVIVVNHHPVITVSGCGPSCAGSTCQPCSQRVVIPSPNNLIHDEEQNTETTRKITSVGKISTAVRHVKIPEDDEDYIDQGHRTETTRKITRVGNDLPVRRKVTLHEDYDEYVNTDDEFRHETPHIIPRLRRRGQISRVPVSTRHTEEFTAEPIVEWLDEEPEEELDCGEHGNVADKEVVLSDDRGEEDFEDFAADFESLNNDYATDVIDYQPEYVSDVKYPTPPQTRSPGEYPGGALLNMLDKKPTDKQECQQQQQQQQKTCQQQTNQEQTCQQQIRPQFPTATRQIHRPTSEAHRRLAMDPEMKFFIHYFRQHGRHHPYFYIKYFPQYFYRKYRRPHCSRCHCKH